MLSVLGIAVATGLVLAGKMGGENWVYALAVVLAGHHAADIVRAARGAGTPQNVTNETIDVGDAHIGAQENS